MSNSIDEEIGLRAHQLWESAGKPEGRELEFWYEAERQLKREASNPDETSDPSLE